MVRKKSKKRKLLGSRTWGGGSAKKRRGAGHRGGKGWAGSGKKKKTKWTWVIKYQPDYFGSHGFKRPQNQVFEPVVVNLDQVEELVEKHNELVVGRDGEDRAIIDLSKLGVDKVLGRGKIGQPMVIRAPTFSKTAKQKLEAIGGKAVSIVEQEEPERVIDE
ncbi:MAG: 50S ribosomal protein L15 [Methanobacteriota archaeon]|nr:MAG: 50S ribosomal protein L15 [Euryarchaeota archaeon]